MSESRTEAEAAPGTDIRIDENEVKDIIESILQEAQYFDASSMAPLTPTALVSFSLSFLRGT